MNRAEAYKWGIRIATFFAGGGLGGTVVYFITKKKYEEFAQREIDSVKAHYKNKSLETTVSISKDEEGHTVATIETQESLFEDPAKALEMANLVVQNEYASKSSIDYDALAAARIFKGDRTPLAEGPKIITFEQFSGEMDEYDKISITYYAVDDALVDEYEEMIDDPESLIGRGTLNAFSEEVGVIYVRNDLKRIDYEITSEDISYKEAVLGLIPDTPESRKPRR